MFTLPLYEPLGCLVTKTLEYKETAARRLMKYYQMGEPHEIYYPPSECAATHIRSFERWREASGIKMCYNKQKKNDNRHFRRFEECWEFLPFLPLFLLCKKFQFYATQTSRLCHCVRAFLALESCSALHIVFPLRCCARSALK